MPTPALPYGTPDSSAELRLFCLPYGGGSAATYKPWRTIVPRQVDLALVEPPARGARFGEPAATDARALASELASELLPHVDRPWALFGHSMGALVAYELALALLARGARAPTALFVSGRQAPHLPYRTQPLHALGRDELLAELRRLNGTPADVLNHPTLLDLMLPVLRSDFALCEAYVPSAPATLPCPISVFGGIADPLVPREDLEAWRQYTAGECRVRVLPGDHFYFSQSPAAMLGALLQDFYRWARPAGR